MALVKLPDEVLLEIIKYLSPAPDPKAKYAEIQTFKCQSEAGNHLYGLNLSCRQMYEITLPYLYSAYFQCGLRNLGCFTRTIVMRPELAEYVRVLQVVSSAPKEQFYSVTQCEEEGSEEQEEPEYQWDLAQYQPNEEKMLKVWIRNHSTNSPPLLRHEIAHYIRRLGNLEWMSQASLLLASCPNATELYFYTLDMADIHRYGTSDGTHPREPSFTTFIYDVLSQGWDLSSEYGILKKVKKVVYSCESVRAGGWKFLGCIIPFLHLQSVSELYTRGLEYDCDEIGSFMEQISSRNISHFNYSIEKLKLFDFDGDMITLGEFLGLFRSVRAFGINVETLTLDPLRVLQGLGACHQTLEVLHMENSYQRGGRYYKMQPEDNKNFKKFKKLKHLDILTNMMASEQLEDCYPLKEIVPQSLETLVIQHCDLGGAVHLARKIKQLLAQKSTLCPSLNHIMIGFNGSEIDSVQWSEETQRRSSKGIYTRLSLKDLERHFSFWRRERKLEGSRCHMMELFYQCRAAKVELVLLDKDGFL